MNDTKKPLPPDVQDILDIVKECGELQQQDALDIANVITIAIASYRRGLFRATLMDKVHDIAIAGPQGKPKL